MTAEEAIDLIERSAVDLPGLDLRAFAAKARDDINIYRREPIPPPPFDERVMRDQPEGPAEPVFPAPPFAVPERYSEEPELWLVFTAFMAWFVDPIAYAVHVARVLPELGGERPINRAVFLSDVEPSA